MTLLSSLPAELRLQIYDYLPDLQQNHHVILTTTTELTPSICRVNQMIRTETLPIYATNSLFALQIDNAGLRWTARIACLLNGLGPNSISKIRSLQISRHWSIPQPERWQGHVGFYVRIEQRKPSCSESSVALDSSSAGPFRPEWNARFVHPMTEGNWEVTTGTYPLAHDLRGMRSESAKLLALIVRQHLHVPKPSCTDGLKRRDVEFLVQAMDVVAAHPISTYNADPGEYARRRSEVWSNMEQKLRALDSDPGSTGIASEAVSSPYFTPS